MFLLFERMFTFSDLITNAMKTLKLIGITLFVLVILIIGFAKMERIAPLSMVDKDDLNVGLFSNVVINGYDAVSYHTQNKALAGQDDIYSEWHGGKWLFSSPENKDLFDSHPEQYAPIFGGYCVYAITKGVTANTDPEIFEIIDGQLILFAAEDVHVEWMKDPSGNLEVCSSNWNE